MAFDFRQFLVIGISTRALFDLEEENRVFDQQGLEAYSRFQLDHEDDLLNPGVAFPLVKAILGLNRLVQGKRKAEIVIMSRNNADTSLRIFKSVDSHGLDITRAAFTSGASLAPYLHSFDVDLFLSANDADVQAAVDAGVAAARVYEPPEGKSGAPVEQIRIAFDGDAVLFSDEAERIYQEGGLDAFVQHERDNARKPLPEGPFAKLLKTLAAIQADFDPQAAPIRTALVTARNSPAHERVIRTLRAWDVRVDEAFFMGGASKDNVLEAFRPHIYFDDQDLHLRTASHHVAVALVPVPSSNGAQLALEPDLVPQTSEQAASPRGRMPRKQGK